AASAPEAAASAARLVAAPGDATADAGAGEATGVRPLAGRLDPEQDSGRTDLWQRVREGFAMPDIDDPLVHKWEQWYSSQPDYVQRMTERGSRYLFYVLEEVQRRHMPTELALLPFVESAFNPRAVSRTRASGMWQFMPGTGKDFDLRQNLFRDDRRDVLVSTRAALDYLQQLHDQFGDWQLALAAYNWGPGNVQRAVERNRRAGLPTDFESLQRLPQETREYLPKLQAVKNIIRDPQAYALTLPPLENHPYFIGVKIERDIDVALAARLAGLAPEEFQQLNPQLNKPVILAAGGARLLLPYDNANRFLHALAAHEGPLATWTAWVAPRTVTAAQAARLTGMKEAWLREINKIPPRMLVKAGSTLVVPRAAQQQHDVAAPLAENATIALAPEGRPLRRVLHKAGRHGETLASVALRYRVSLDALARWNRVSPRARFKPGQTVVVMVAPQSEPHRHAPTRHRRPVRVAKAAARAPAHRHGPVHKPALKHAAHGRHVAAHHRRPAEVTRVAQAQAQR
ncbi:MAG: transglycosylase SLT domain-containing protein, partial [Burkholderiales bacterium]|nr:transglycosylase SLT domain-containing protein [Burkholderiales bacterium]